MHGIPSKKRTLVEGDIVSIDVGVQYEGYHTDSATTVAVGKVSEESERLLRVTREALDAGVKAARVTLSSRSDSSDTLPTATVVAESV
ncbi:MAG TPA: M24 family metallopeptidase [Gemmatimonadaceae bacterium]|nr:M24 family metallopeptidase [Gemmatimonadaceae bacterium]